MVEKFSKNSFARDARSAPLNLFVREEKREVKREREREGERQTERERERERQREREGEREREEKLSTFLLFPFVRKKNFVKTKQKIFLRQKKVMAAWRTFLLKFFHAVGSTVLDKRLNWNT